MLVCYQSKENFSKKILISALILWLLFIHKEKWRGQDDVLTDSKP
jgi:hypothetical protein